MRKDFVSLRDEKRSCSLFLSLSLSPSHSPFVRRECESCGKSPREIVAAYSQAPYTFRLSSDRRPSNSVRRRISLSAIPSWKYSSPVPLAIYSMAKREIPSLGSLEQQWRKRGLRQVDRFRSRAPDSELLNISISRDVIILLSAAENSRSDTNDSSRESQHKDWLVLELMLVSTFYRVRMRRERKFQ